jgi:Na+-driven multidrug efflux pump
VNTIIVCGIFPAGGDARYDAVSVFFASWCFALPLALLGTFLFKWPVMIIYMLMCSDEIVKLPWIYPRYEKFLWLKNLTREEAASTNV